MGFGGEASFTENRNFWDLKDATSASQALDSIDGLLKVGEGYYGTVLERALLSALWFMICVSVGF